jgi:hypothetical protein
MTKTVVAFFYGGITEKKVMATIAITFFFVVLLQ